MNAELRGKTLYMRVTQDVDDFEQAIENMQAIIQLATESNCESLFLDRTQGTSSLAHYEYINLAIMTGNEFPKFKKVALLIRNDQFETAEYWKAATAKRGVLVEVFTDRAEAEVWLHTQSAPQIH